MSGKRWILLLVLCLLPLVLSATDLMSDAADSRFLVEGFPDIVIGAIVPIIALLLAGSAFAGDMEEGTAVFILAKPVSRARILLERFAATVAVALILTTAAAFFAILVQSGRADDIGSFLIANVLAIAAGTIVYAALFLALSLVTRRGIIIGLLYILLWESTLSGQLPGTRTLSIKEYMLTIAGALDKSGLSAQATAVTLSTALSLACGLLLFAIFLALRKLQNYEVTEQG